MITTSDCARLKQRRCAKCELGVEHCNQELNRNSTLEGAKNTQDCYDALKEKFIESINLLQDVKSEYKDRLQYSIAGIKSEIELRVESLKADLDILRDSLFNEIDNSEKTLLDAIEKPYNHFNLVNSNLIRESNISVEKLNEQLESFINQIQDYFNLTSKIDFEESELQIANEDSNTEKFVGKLNLRLNKYIPNTKWKYEHEDFNVDRYRCIQSIYQTDICAVKNLGIDGLFATCSNQGPIKVWNTNTGINIGTIDYNATRLFVLPNHKILTKDTDYESEIGIIDLDDLKIEQTGLDKLIYNNFVMLENGLVVCSESSRNVGGFTHFDIVYFRIEGFSLKPEYRIKNCHSLFIGCLEALPNSELASTAADNTIKIWSSDYQLIRTMHGHLNTAVFVKYIGENLILSAAYDKTVRIWNYQNGECLKIVEITGYQIHDLVVSPSDGFFAIMTKGFSYQDVRIYEMNHYQCVLQVNHNFFDRYIQAFDYLGDKRFLLATDSQIKIFDFKGEIKYKGISL